MQGDIDPPDWLADIMAAVAGENWPDVSEMDLLNRARAMEETARKLEEIGPQFMAASQEVLDITKGAGAEAFRKKVELFARGDGSEKNPGVFPGLIESSKKLAEGLQAASNNVETAKITIIGMAALVFAELVAAAISLVISFGAAAAAGAALIKTTIMIIRRLVVQLIKSILMGALMMGGMNFMAQLIQVIRGHRANIDFKEIGKQALLGGASGLLGFGIGKGVGKVLGKFGKTFAGEIINNTLTEGLTEHALAKIIPLVDKDAKEDDPGALPFVGGAAESIAEGLHGKAKSSTKFKTFNVPTPSMNIDIPNMKVDFSLEKGTPTGAPLPSPGISFPSGKTGLFDPSTGQMIDTPPGAQPPETKVPDGAQPPANPDPLKSAPAPDLAPADTSTSSAPGAPNTPNIPQSNSVSTPPDTAPNQPPGSNSGAGVDAGTPVPADAQAPSNAPTQNVPPATSDAPVPNNAPAQESTPFPNEAPPVQQPAPAQQNVPTQQNLSIPDSAPVQQNVSAPDNAPVPENAPVLDNSAPVPDTSPESNNVLVPDDAPVPENSPAPDNTSVPDNAPVLDNNAPVPDITPTPTPEPEPENFSLSDNAPIPDSVPAPDSTPSPQNLSVPETVQVPNDDSSQNNEVPTQDPAPQQVTTTPTPDTPPAPPAPDTPQNQAPPTPQPPLTTPPPTSSPDPVSDPPSPQQDFSSPPPSPEGAPQHSSSSKGTELSGFENPNGPAGTGSIGDVLAGGPSSAQPSPQQPTQPSTPATTPQSGGGAPFVPIADSTPQSPTQSQSPAGAPAQQGAAPGSVPAGGAPLSTAPGTAGGGVPPAGRPGSSAMPLSPPTPQRNTGGKPEDPTSTVPVATGIPVPSPPPKSKKKKSVPPPATTPTADKPPTDPKTTPKGKTPTMVSPSPDAITPGMWKPRKNEAPAAPLRTERFDPKADPLASDRPGLLNGWGTLIRTDIRRVQADNGAWVRDLTVALPVKVGDGLDPSQIPALEQHIQNLFDTHVNTGFTLPKSGDQLNIDVKLTPVTNKDPYAVNVTVSPEPGRSDQLNFNLHPPTATPSQKTRDDATLLHEVLHYTGLSDRYNDSDSLFRKGPGKGDTTGVMANVSVLPDGTFPLEYLTEIENTTDSGPVVHDLKLDATSNDPGPDAPGGNGGGSKDPAPTFDDSSLAPDSVPEFKQSQFESHKNTLFERIGDINELSGSPEFQQHLTDFLTNLQENGAKLSGGERPAPGTDVNTAAIDGIIDGLTSIDGLKVPYDWYTQNQNSPEFEDLRKDKADHAVEHGRLWSKLNVRRSFIATAETGGVFLESSVGGKIFNDLSFGFPWNGSPAMSQLWEKLSSTYVGGLSGTVNADVLDGIHPTSVLTTIEWERLKDLIAKGQVDGLTANIFTFENSRFQLVDQIPVKTQEEFDALAKVPDTLEWKDKQAGLDRSERLLHELETKFGKQGGIGVSLTPTPLGTPAGGRPGSQSATPPQTEPAQATEEFAENLSDQLNELPESLKSDGPTFQDTSNAPPEIPEIPVNAGDSTSSEEDADEEFFDAVSDLPGDQEAIPDLPPGNVEATPPSDDSSDDDSDDFVLAPEFPPETPSPESTPLETDTAVSTDPKGPETETKQPDDQLSEPKEPVQQDPQEEASGSQQDGLDKPLPPLPETNVTDDSPEVTPEVTPESTPPSRQDPLFAPVTPVAPDAVRQPPARVTENQQLSGSDMLVGLHRGDTAVLDTITGAFANALQGNMPAATTLAQDFFDPNTLRPTLSSLSRGNVLSAPFQGNGYSGHVTIRAEVDRMDFQSVAPKMEFENGSERQSNLGSLQDVRLRGTAGVQARFKVGQLDITETFGYNHDSTKGTVRNDGGRTIARAKTGEAAAVFAANVKLTLDFGGLKKNGLPFTTSGSTTQSVDIGATVAIPSRDTLDAKGEKPVLDKRFAPPQRVVDGRRLGSSDVVLDVRPNGPARGGANAMNEIFSKVDTQGEQYAGSLWPKLKQKLMADLDLTSLQQDLKGMMAGQKTHVEVTSPDGRTTVGVDISASVTSMKHTDNTGATEFNVGTGVQRSKVKQSTRTDNVTVPAPLALSTPAANPLTFSGGAAAQIGLRDQTHLSASGQEVTVTTKTKAPGAVFDGIATLHLDFTRTAPNGNTSGGRADTEIGFSTLIEQSEAREIKPETEPTNTTPTTNIGEGTSTQQGGGIDEITVADDPQTTQGQSGGTGTSTGTTNDPTEFVADPTQPLTPPEPRTFEPGSQVFAPPDGVFPSTAPNDPRGGLGDTVTVRDVSDISPLHDALNTAGQMALGGSWKDIKQDILATFSHSKVASRLTSMTRGLPLESPLLSPSPRDHDVKVSATAHVVDMEFKRHEAKAEVNPVSENSTSNADRTVLSTAGTVQGGGEVTVGLVSAGYTHAHQVRDRGGWRDGSGGKISANGKFAQPQALFTSTVRLDLKLTVNGRDYPFTADLPAELSLPAANAKTYTVGQDGRAVFNGPGSGETQPRQPPAQPHNPPQRITDRGAVSASDVVVSLGNNDTAVLNTIETTLDRHAGTLPDDVRMNLRETFDPVSLKAQLSKLSRGGVITEQVSVGGFKGSVTVTATLKDFAHTDTAKSFEFEAGSQLRTGSGISKDERVRTTHGIPVKGKAPNVDINATFTRTGDQISSFTADSAAGTGSRSKTVEPAGLFTGTAEFTVEFDLKNAKKLGRPFPVLHSTVPVEATVAVPLRDAPAPGAEGAAPVKQNITPPKRIEQTQRLGSTDVVTDVFPVTQGTDGGRPGIAGTVDGLSPSGQQTLGSDWPGIKKKIEAELDLDNLQVRLKSMMAGQEIVVEHGRSTVRISASVSSLWQTGETTQTEFNNGANVQRNFGVTDGVTNLSTGTATGVTVGAQATTSPVPGGPSFVAGGSGTYVRGKEDLSVQSSSATSGVTTKSKLPGTAFSGEAQLIFKMERKPRVTFGDSNRAVPTPPSDAPATEVLKNKVERIGTPNRTITTAKIGFSTLIEESAGGRSDTPQRFDAPAPGTSVVDPDPGKPAVAEPVPQAEAVVETPAEVVVETPAETPAEAVVETPVKAPPARVFDGGLRDLDVMRSFGDASGIQDILRTRGPEFFGTKTWSRLESVVRNTDSHSQLSGRFSSVTRGENIVTPDPGKRLFVSSAGVETSMKVMQLEYDGTDTKAELSPANEASSSSQRTHLDWSLFGGQAQLGAKASALGAAEGTFLGTGGGSRRDRDGTTHGDGGRTMSHAKFPTAMARYTGFAEVQLTFVDGDRRLVEKGVVPISIDIPERETTDATVMSDHRLTFSPEHPDGDDPVPLNRRKSDAGEDEEESGEFELGESSGTKGNDNSEDPPRHRSIAEIIEGL